MRIAIRVGAAALLTTSALAYVATQPSVVDRDNATPASESLIWKTERDLIVLFENSNDRVALSLRVRDVCLDASSGLTVQQRYDGLKIAGHTLYRERELTDAMPCFEGIITLNYTEDSVADAARMKAQAHMLLSEFEAAVSAFQLCDGISRQIENSEGFHDLYRQNFLGYLQAAFLSQDHALVVSLVDEIMANPAKYQSVEADPRVSALEMAAESALREDEAAEAAAYLTTLLDTFPDYGTEFPGERARVVMRRLDAMGHSLDERDPVAVEAAMTIVQNSDYYGMPVWAFYVDQSARILDEVDDVQAANELRMWAVDRLQEKHDSLSPSDMFVGPKRNAIRQNQADLIYRTARMKQQVKRVQEAIVLYQRLVTDFSDVAPDYAQDAGQQIQGMQSAP